MHSTGIYDQLAQTMPSMLSMSTKEGYKRQFSIEYVHKSEEASTLGVKPYKNKIK